VFGRDQFGVVNEPVAPTYDEHLHPGFDFESEKRTKPWEPKQPDPAEKSWLPSKDLTRLGW
jgi:hypothetical protein